MLFTFESNKHFETYEPIISIKFEIFWTILRIVIFEIIVASPILLILESSLVWTATTIVHANIRTVVVVHITIVIVI
jgi:hypothetical protein